MVGNILAESSRHKAFKIASKLYKASYVILNLKKYILFLTSTNRRSNDSRPYMWKRLSIIAQKKLLWQFFSHVFATCQCPGYSQLFHLSNLITCIYIMLCLSDLQLIENNVHVTSHICNSNTRFCLQSLVREQAFISITILPHVFHYNSFKIKKMILHI